MDRIELRKFLDEEQAAALGWYENAKKAVAELERTLEDFNEYVLSVGKSNLSDKEREEYKAAKALMKEAREELIFFDGVKQGADMVAKQIRESLMREELANAGRWVPKIFKPRRR